MNWMSPDEINEILAKAHEKSKEPIAEYGCSMPVQFAKGTMYREDGEVVLCKCGKEAENVFIGKEAYLARCNACYENPGEK